MQEDEFTGIQDHSANLFQPVGLRKFNHSIGFDGRRMASERYLKREVDALPQIDR